MKLIEDASDSEFEAEIGQRFDLPQLAGYLAATSLLSSLDSYVGAPHNYYLMLDKADGTVAPACAHRRRHAQHNR